MISAPDRAQGQDSLRWPFFLPDGVHFLYSAINLSGNKQVDSIFVSSLDSNEKHFVIKAGGSAMYATPGYLLFYRDQTLFAQHFDAAKFTVSGEPVPIFPDVQFAPRIARVVFAASGTGLLVAQRVGDWGSSQVVWFDRKGQETGIALKSGIYGNISLSPDGNTVASDATDSASQNTDVWTYNLGTQSTKRLTFDPAIESMPTWSPDGATSSSLRTVDSTSRYTKRIPTDRRKRHCFIRLTSTLFPLRGRTTENIYFTRVAPSCGTRRSPTFSRSYF